MTEPVSDAMEAATQLIVAGERLGQALQDARFAPTTANAERRFYAELFLAFAAFDYVQVWMRMEAVPVPALMLRKIELVADMMLRVSECIDTGQPIPGDLGRIVEEAYVRKTTSSN